MGPSVFFILVWSSLQFFKPEEVILQCQEFRDAVAAVDIERIKDFLSEDFIAAHGSKVDEKDFYLQRARVLDRAFVPKSYQGREPILLPEAVCRKKNSLSGEERSKVKEEGFAYIRLVNNGENLQPRRRTLRELVFQEQEGVWKLVSWSPSLHKSHQSK